MPTAGSALSLSAGSESGLLFSPLGAEPRVASMLSEFEENQATKALLEAYGSKKVPQNADFDPALAAVSR